MKRLFTIIFSLFCFVASVSAQNVKASQDKKARLEREIAIIDKQIAANASKSSSKLAELELLRKKIENRKALLDEADSEIRTYDAMISKAKKQMDALQARVDTLSEHYSRLVMSAYKNRDTRLWYMYILSSDNIAQAFRRMSYFKNLSNQMNADARRLQQAKDELAEQKEAMDALRSNAQKVRQERASELNRLKAEETEANVVVRQLNRDKKKYQSQLASKKKEVEALNKELARLVAQSMKQQGGKSSKSILRR